MLTSDNDESNSDHNNKNQSKANGSNQINENKNSKVKILSQTLLKAANLTSKKEFLNKVLENSKTKIEIFNKVHQKDGINRITHNPGDEKLEAVDKDTTDQICKEISSKHTWKQENANLSKNNLFNKNHLNSLSSSDSNSGQMEFIGNIEKQRDRLDSDNGMQAIKSQKRNDEMKKEIISDSDSSAEFEKKIRKTQISKLDVTENTSKPEIYSSSDTDSNKGKRNINTKKRNLEVLSDSSTSDSEKDNNNVNVETLNKPRLIEKFVKSDSSNSESEIDNKATKKKTSTNNKNKNVKRNAKNISRSSSSDSESKKSLRKSESSSVDSESDSSSSDKNTHKSDSSNSDTDISVHDQKRNSENAKNKAANNVRETSQSKHQSESSDSDSKKKSSKSNKKKISHSTKYKNITKNNSVSTDSDSDNTSLIGSENKSKLKRKFIETQSSDEESKKIIHKKRKHSENYRQEHLPSESEKLLQAFSEVNEYSQVVPKHEKLVNILDKNEEVYLVQMPKCIDPHLLTNKILSFDGPTKLKIENESYIWNVNYENQNDVIVMDFNNLLTLKPKGIISLQQYFRTKNKSIEVIPAIDIDDSPSNLKIRHPLFGTEYKEKMKLDDDILLKLEEIVATIDKKHKKKSKKKHKKEIETEQTENLDIFKLLNEHENQTKDDCHENKDYKKKKHKKHKEEPEILETIDEVQSISSKVFPVVKKLKKKKKDKSVPLIDEEHSKLDKNEDKNYLYNISGRDEIQFSTPTINYEKIRTSKDNVLDSFKKDSQENLLENYKRKKKRKHHTNIGDDVPASSIDDFSSDSKVKQQLNISEDDYKQHKKNKKKKNPMQVVNSTMSTSDVGDYTIFRLDESCIPKAKKKKRDKHGDNLDNFIDDLIKNVTSSDDSRQIKKKKRKHSHSDKTEC